MSRLAPAFLSRAAILALLLVVTTTPAARATGFPTPGGAAGSTTGDSARPFTGLAETPRAAAFTGAAVTSIPFELPPGRAGSTPRLHLQYSSGEGAGPYGYGWTLPIARVVRSTKNGVPRYDGSDTFVLETNGGSLELNPVAGTKRYVAKIESGFLRIGFDPARNQWKVIDKSGTVMTFGTKTAERMGPNPGSADGTYAWLLARSVDATGNHVDYAYLPPSSAESSTPGLPSRVDYGGNLRAGVAHLFSARFVWSAPTYPSVVPVSLRAGFRELRNRLLMAVETYAANDIVRRYAMSHDQDPASGAIRLVAVSLDGFAADSSLDVALPSTTFSYSDAVTADWPVGSPAYRASLGDEMAAPGPVREIGSEVRFDTFDINGDGLVDWVDVRPAQPIVKLGTSTGFAPAKPWQWPSQPRLIRKVDENSAHLVVNVFDITGDGLPDLVESRGTYCQVGRWCVYRNLGNGFQTTPTLWSAPLNDIRYTHANGDKVLIDVVDMNGDGRPDWVDTTRYSADFPYWFVHWNTGNGFATTRFQFRAHRGHISVVSDVGGGRQQLNYGLFDMNGDALPDFVMAVVAGQSSPAGSQDHWDVYLNTGSGFEDEPIDWRVEDPRIDLPGHINETGGGSTGAYAYRDLIDINGDGLPDWVRPWTSADAFPPVGCDQQPLCTANGTAVPPECCFSLVVFVNTGSSFSAPVPWSMWHDYELRHTRETIPAGERQFELLDFDGDGLVDLLEIDGGPWRVYRHPASPLAKWSQTPLQRRARPNLLLSMMNGVGGETHLAYAPASVFASNRIPFPYWAVVRREVRDGITNSSAATSTYRYAGGLWKGDARELRGFRHVWETDAAGITVATEFHQDDRLQGLVMEAQVLGPAPCSTTTPMDPDDPCSPLNDRLRIDTNAWSGVGPVLLEGHSSTPCYQNIPVTDLSKLNAYLYDEYGNVVRELVYSPSVGTVQTDSTYAYSLTDEAQGWPGRYLVDKPIRSVTHAATAPYAPVAEKTYLYDAPSPVTGLLAQAATCIEWSSSNTCTRWKTVAYKHDKAGNVTTVAGPRGGVTGNEYDAQLLYARLVRNAAGHVTQSVHDLRNGRETLKRAPDGRVFETRYDGLGRPVRSWSDGFSNSQPEVLATYTNGVPNGSPGWVRTRENGSPPVVVFFDGLGRELATKSIAETVSGNRTIVQGMKLYDAVGRLTAQSVPFPARDARIEVLEATAADAPGWTRYVYDGRGRLTQTILPDGTRTLHDSSKPGVRVTVYANLAAATHPGKADVELLDGLDRVWRKDECSAAPLAANPGQCRSGTLIGRTDFEYDGLDRTTRITSGAHTSDPAETLLRYDGLGNRTMFASSDLGEWRYEYDVEGLLAKAIDPRGVTVFNDYDSIGRLRRQRGQDFDARYSYYRRDAGTGLVRRIRTRSGRAQIGKEFVYDSRGRVVREDLRMRADGPSFENTTLYEYDDADRRVSVTYPSERSGHGRKVVTTYSAYGHPLALTAYDDGVATSIVGDVGYDLLGNTRVVQYGNGLSDVFGYATAERLGRLECLRTTRDLTPSATCTSDSQDERRLAVGARDAAGNILSIGDYRHTTSSPLRDDHTFGYDSFGRLTATSATGSGNQTYAYDVHGNVSAGQNGIYAYAAGAPHRPTIGSDQVIEHDAAGNRTRKGAWRYAYDALGRLFEVHHNGVLEERAFYDEGRTRIARYDPDTDSVRYYVGGLFEVEGSTLVRHYWLGGRIVASDVVPAPDHMRAAAVLSTASQAGGATAGSVGMTEATVDHGSLDGFDTATAVGAAFVLCLLAFLIAAATAGASGSGVALVTALAFVVATTPFPALARAASSADVRGGVGLRGTSAAHRSDLTHAVTTGTRTFFYHPDYVGSPYMVSDESGTIVEHRRYDAYGGLRRVLNDQGSPLTDTATDVSFTGQQGDENSGLIYFGSRYYDAELGLFLTPDPQAQFASPYLYGGGNPVNGVDPDGEIFDVLAAILVPILVSAAVSAVVSGVVAALQGGDFLQAFGSGFVGGLIGGALGTVLGSLNVAYQFFAGGAQYIQAAEALQAVVEVASRSAFTTAVSQSAVSVADAAGLSSDWVTAISVVTPLLASYTYDNYIIKDSGAASGIGSSQRELAKTGVQNVNTSVGHTNVTEAATQGTGWERNASELVKYNLAEDGPAPTGNLIKDTWGNAKALAMNHNHFGRLPSSISGVQGIADAGFEAAGRVATPEDPLALFRQAVGAATHYVQDHLTLGHMVPGTSLFWGPPGAPIRFVIHQVFGGEIAFRDAQIRATRGFLLHNGLVT